MQRPTDEHAAEILGMMGFHRIKHVPPPYHHLSLADTFSPR